MEMKLYWRWCCRLTATLAAMVISTLVIHSLWVENPYILHQVSGHRTSNSKSSLVWKKNKSLDRYERLTGLNVDANLHKQDVQHCPAYPPGLVGEINVTFIDEKISWSNLESRHPDVKLGGKWSPSSCKPNHKVAILIPFRDREEHLKIFLNHIHPFLQKQLLDYTIYVIEQSQYYRFNRGLLLNIGFIIANQTAAYDCFFFHDVDSLPANDRIFYTCPDYPRHMASALEKFKFETPYDSYLGGVLGIRTEQFIKVNGFSNVYFGWGAEDDDFWMRLHTVGLPVQRWSASIAKFRVIPHQQARETGDRFRYLNAADRRIHSEGLNSVKFKLENIEIKRLYTRIYVKLNKTEIRQTQYNSKKIE